MGEVVVVHQHSDLSTMILASDPEHPDSQELVPVEDMRSLTPYGMLLASLGCCTAIVLHTYAQHHNVRLPEVELRLTYERVFSKDCKNCESEKGYQESIEQEIILGGEHTPLERRKLLRAAGYCPIHKILSEGITVKSHLGEGKAHKATGQKA